MSKSNAELGSTKQWITGERVAYLGSGWAIAALLFFLIYGAGEGRPLWYIIGTYIFETLAFLGAAFLCFRNVASSFIASGRMVWFSIGLGNFCYSIGDLIFGFWEIYWGLNPDVSIADFFFLLFYIFVSWGIILAVLPRRINLSRWQWLTILSIAVIGVAIAVLLTFTSPANAQSPVSPIPTPPRPTLVTPNSPRPTGATPVPSPRVSPTNRPIASPSPTPVSTPSPVESPAPARIAQPPTLIVELDQQLEPFDNLVSFIYVVFDVFLLVLATMLLLSFWGGRFGLSWQMIGGAAFCMYIADIWFKYADDRIPNYQSGSLLEVFWVFSGVLFGIGAALEYDTSARMRRGGRKRA